MVFLREYCTSFYDSYFFLVNTMLPFAPPSFIGLPTDEVKKVDPYGVVNPEVQTAIASKLTAFELGFDKLVSNSLDMVKGIGSKLRTNGISIPEARDRIKDALGGSRQGISYLAEGLENMMIGDMTGKDPGTGYVRTANDMIDGVQMVINGKNAVFNQGNFPNVAAITDFIGDLTGNNLLSVFDLGAEAALVKGILSEVTAWGVPQIVDETFGAKWNETDKRYDYKYDDEFRFSVVKRVSEDLSPTTSLATIEQLMIHGGPTALVAMNPAFPEQLLEQYLFPLGIVPSGDPQRPDLRTYAQELEQLVKILNQLKPDWFQLQRMVYNPGGNPVYKPELVWNLRFISRASEDAKKLLMSEDKYIAPLLTAPFYDVYNGKQVLKNMYPYIVLQ